MHVTIGKDSGNLYDFRSVVIIFVWADRKETILSTAALETTTQVHWVATGHNILDALRIYSMCKYSSSGSAIVCHLVGGCMRM
jgi:hypothetical protein